MEATERLEDADGDVLTTASTGAPDLSALAAGLSIEATAEEVAPSIDRAVRSLGNEVKIPGFRKGHVPRKILESRIGRDARRDEEPHEDHEAEREVRNVKTRRTTMGGWAQPRYQRHIENFHLHHIKEVIDVLAVANALRMAWTGELRET